MNLSYDFFRYESPAGTLTVVADRDAVYTILFGGQPPRDNKEHSFREKRTPILETTLAELDAWFAGTLKAFSVPVNLSGTAFQKDVWNAIAKIPYGERRTYGEIARRIDKPNAARAVGGACNRNPVPIIIPCHRVIGANGSLTGFGGGLEIKKELLALEQRAAFK